MSEMADIAAHYRGGQLDRFIAAVNELEVQLLANSQTFVPVHEKTEIFAAEYIRSIPAAYCAVIVAMHTKWVGFS